MSFANNKYILDDQVINSTFENAEDITSKIIPFSNSFTTISNAPNITKGGYLLRAFFCSTFAIHRSYMGTGGKNLFWIYFCTGGGCGIVSLVDFWAVLFGSDYMKLRDNPKFWGWSSK